MSSMSGFGHLVGWPLGRVRSHGIVLVGRWRPPTATSGPTRWAASYSWRPCLVGPSDGWVRLDVVVTGGRGLLAGVGERRYRGTDCLGLRVGGLQGCQHPSDLAFGLADPFGDLGWPQFRLAVAPVRHRSRGFGHRRPPSRGCGTARVHGRQRLVLMHRWGRRRLNWRW